MNEKDTRVKLAKKKLSKNKVTFFMHREPQIFFPDSSIDIIESYDFFFNGRVQTLSLQPDNSKLFPFSIVAVQPSEAAPCCSEHALSCDSPYSGYSTYTLMVPAYLWLNNWNFMYIF